MNSLLSNPFQARAFSTTSYKLGCGSAVPPPISAEIAATSGYDWLLIDGEHAPNTIPIFIISCRPLPLTSSQPVIRPVEGQTKHHQADAGYRCPHPAYSDGVIHLSKREIVSTTRYPPLGTRGVGASVARAARWGRIENYMASGER